MSDSLFFLVRELLLSEQGQSIKELSNDQGTNDQRSLIEDRTILWLPHDRRSWEITPKNDRYGDHWRSSCGRAGRKVTGGWILTWSFQSLYKRFMLGQKSWHVFFVCCVSQNKYSSSAVKWMVYCDCTKVIAIATLSLFDCRSGRQKWSLQCSTSGSNSLIVSSVASASAVLMSEECDMAVQLGKMTWKILWRSFHCSWENDREQHTLRTLLQLYFTRRTSHKAWNILNVLNWVQEEKYTL